MHIPIISIAEFQFLAQFSMDHLSHPVVSVLMLFLRKFSVFPYVINCFIFIITLLTLAFLLRITINVTRF